MIRTTISSLSLLFCLLVFAQSFPEKELKKKLKADLLEMDPGNGDGVFRARHKKTKKWGMYQWGYEGTNTTEMIPMEYDSVRFFPFNGNFTAVYKKGKVGIYLCSWSYDSVYQSVPCLYSDYQRFTAKNQTYLAMQKDSVWGWVNWKTGEEKSSFKYATTDDLPYPYFKQEN